MSESHVVTVVPSVNNSFKLAVSDSLVGSMTQDRATGVFGKLGTSPKMIPVKLSITTSRGQDQTLNFEIAQDEALTPDLAQHNDVQLAYSLRNERWATRRSF
jgi:hypothetical protein